MSTSDGPYYEDMERGLIFPAAPAVVLDSGLASVYQSIVGEALPLVLDPKLCGEITGIEQRIVSPGLLLHLSIGASTVATKKVIANLFYRNVRILRPVFLGEVLHTTTEVVALQDSRSKNKGTLRGKVLLKITTFANDEKVLEYYRAPLIRLKGKELPGHNDDLGSDSKLNLNDYQRSSYKDWKLSLLQRYEQDIPSGVINDPLKDVLDQALALVRLTQNVASVHRDVNASPYPNRLVYGGHTVALAQASLSRIFKNTATILGWHLCNHTGPVFEEDLLSFQHEVIDKQEYASGNIIAVRSRVFVHRDNEKPQEVLEWIPIILTS
tara:strand:- start:4970 stop:5944 length:975 start_codon:yes stop_codon:yes gene_type:complete